MNSFYHTILDWYDNHSRDLPWRNSRNAYNIWLSEIILQQTRVDQGLKYYHRFINQYPTIFALAEAKEDEVLKLWEGLGYYSRGRNLLKTAQQIVNDYQGIFPNTAEELSKLKGIGPYTSAAISSIVNNEKIAAVDGNVFRVLARYFDINLDISIPKTRKYFEELSTSLIEGDRPGDYNQAIMDLGSSICSPKRMNCVNCPLNNSCKAFAENIVEHRPVKTKKLKIKDRYLNFVLIQSQDGLIIEKRDEGIWKGLYQLPLIESQTLNMTSNELSQMSKDLKLKNIHRIKTLERPHKLSHQNLFINFWKAETDSKKEYVAFDKIDQYSFPKPIKDFLEVNI